MPLREIVRRELRRDAAPSAGQAGAHHRDRCRRARQQPQGIRQEARHAQAEEHERDRKILGAVARRAWWRRQPGARDADHDRGHRQVLDATRVLMQHALGKEHQYEQPRGERRLHDHERRQQQRDELQRPAEDRQARAEQPARAAQQAPREREAQVLAVRRFLRVQRLQRDP